MTKRTYRKTSFKMLAVCCLLTLGLLVGASQAADSGVLEVEPAAVAADVTSVPTSNTTVEVCATPDPGDSVSPSVSVVAAPEWQNQTAGSCQYTCPQNLVQLCPDFPGASKSCVSGCCVYS